MVEAKSTIKNPEVGRHQATLYADAIEREQGLRPITFIQMVLEPLYYMMITHLVKFLVLYSR